jgi:hypothetical protein
LLCGTTTHFTVASVFEESQLPQNETISSNENNEDSDNSDGILG